MADIVGQISLELGLESADFKKQLQNLCKKESQTAANSLTDTFSSAFSRLAPTIAAAFSIGKIIEFGKQSVEAAASVNAANSQLAQTFGDMQDKAESAMQAVAKESGIVETRLQGVGTSIYAFAKTSGMDSTTALSMMKEALQVTADSAAYYDRSLEDTAESLKSFLKGNYANDAALGISCTETTRNAAANKLYGKSFQDLSEAQKQLTLLQMVKDANALSGALGQAARESDGWENVTGNLKEAWKQLCAVIGQPVLQVAVSVVKSLTAAVQQLTVYAQNAVKSISDMFGLQIGDSLDSIAGISTNADSAADSVDDTTDSVKALKKATAGFDQLNILSSDKSDSTDADSSNALPLSFDTSAAENSVDNFGNIFDEIRKKIQKFFKNTGIDKEFSKISQKINSYIQQIATGIQSGLSSFGSFFSNLGMIISESFGSSLENTKQAFSIFFDSIISLVGGAFVIIADAFDIVAGDLDGWVTDNYDTIKLFFDNIFQVIDDTVGVIGEIIQSFVDVIMDWWENDGKKLWDNICKFVLDIGTICLDVFNKWIMPIWDALVKAVRSAWYDCIKPILEKLMHTVSKLWNDIIEPLWKNVLKPLVDWVIDEATPHIQNSLNIIGSIFQTIFDTVRGVINGALDALGGLIDFISGVFTGDWEKAWKGIGDFITGIWDLIWAQIKGTINLIIDGINALWSGIYYAVRGIVDSIGGIAGALGDLFGQDWHFSMPEQPPLIPKLAQGGLATSPTLALVGDNKNAKSDPEVIAPLSKLKSMLLPPAIKALSGSDDYTSKSAPKEKNNHQDIIIMMNKLYELMKNQEEQYINNIYLDSEKIESKLVKIRKRKARRFNVQN